MKRIMQAILILIAVLSLLVMAGYKGTDKGHEHAPGESIPSSRPDIPGGVTAPQIGDVVPGIKSDLNSILETSKLLVEQGDFGRTFSQLGAVLALNDNPYPGKNTLAK